MTMRAHYRPLSGHRSSKGKVLALAALAASLLVACGDAPLPARLAGLRRGRIISGPRAVRMIAELHGQKVMPPAAMVADYGPGGQLRVWLARYRDDGEAERVLLRMVARLSSADSPFARPAEAPGMPRHWSTAGPGGHHLFWVAGSSVYWIAGDPELLAAAASELPEPARGNWT